MIKCTLLTSLLSGIGIRSDPFHLNVAPQIQVPEVQDWIVPFDRLVVLLCCPLALLQFDAPNFFVEVINLFEDDWSVDLYEIGQPETFCPIHITDSNYILQQLDHFGLGSFPVTQGPFAGLVCYALELHVKPEPIDLRIPCGIKPGMLFSAQYTNAFLKSNLMLRP